MPRRCALAALAALLLAGCAAQPARAPVDFATLDDGPFAIAGRVSARHGSEGVAASFRWRHEVGADELLFATPMGDSVARLAGDARGVRLELADGTAAVAGDWEALTARVLGAPFPVHGLAWWVRASPRPGSAFAAEADAARRLEVLRQDGWEIVYAYRDDQTRPLRLTLRAPQTEVRIVVDTWSAP